MDLTRVAFVTMKWTGFSTFPEQTNIFQSLICHVYLSIMKLIIYSFIIVQFHLIMKADFNNIDEVIERFFLFPELIFSALKASNILLKEKKLFVVINVLKNKCFRPVDSVEIKQQQFFDNQCK